MPTLTTISSPSRTDRLGLMMSSEPMRKMSPTYLHDVKLTCQKQAGMQLYSMFAEVQHAPEPGEAYTWLVGTYTLYSFISPFGVCNTTSNR